MTFETAISVLEEQSLVPDDANDANAIASSSSANRSSSNLMVQNHKTLKGDLDQINDLLLIARNAVLSHLAQDLAAQYSFDKVVMKLIDLCVRVTTRGYDGDAGSRNETQWAEVVQGCEQTLETRTFLHK